jgi:hypothetical protein
LGESSKVYLGLTISSTSNNPDDGGIRVKTGSKISKILYGHNDALLSLQSRPRQRRFLLHIILISKEREEEDLQARRTFLARVYDALLHLCHVFHL